MTTPDFDKALNAWLERAQAICNAGNYASQSKPVLTLQYGKRYVKVMRNDTGGRCVFCFVDLTTGDVLKAASIHTPAKGARGTIWEVGNEGVGEYGGNYKR